MKHLMIAFFCIIIFGVQTVFAQNNKDIIIGSKFIINSSILDEDRTCSISLPDSYNDTSNVKKKYPILILLDGYTHFKTASGIVHFMSADRNRNLFMPETIIVAIENVGNIFFTFNLGWKVRLNFLYHLLKFFSYKPIQSSTVIFCINSAIRSKGISSAFLKRTQLLPISNLRLQCFGYSPTNQSSNSGLA